MKSTAKFDPTGKYRFTLTRSWDRDLGRVVFVMLNPSTADEKVNDPTVRRCIGFAVDNGFGSLVVVNLFAYRSTDPKALLRVMDPVGKENDAAIRESAESAERIVAAWGAHPSAAARGYEVWELLQPRPIYCLGTTKAGSPKHPLYVPKVTQFQKWDVII